MVGDIAKRPDWLKRMDPPQAPPRPPAVVRAGGQQQAVERARKYAQKCAQVCPAVSGQNGHSQTFEVARAIVWGFGIGPDAGLEVLLADYNPACLPPWSEKELRHKCQDADSKPFDKPRGYLLDTPNPKAPEPLRRAAPRPAAPKEGCESFAAPAAPEPKAPAEPRKCPVRLVAAFVPFPVHALPPVLSSLVPAAAAAIGCDPALVALPALAAVAGCIGNSRAVVLKKGWPEPPVLWTVTIAESGGHKSPAYHAATGPLIELQMDLFDQHRVDQDEYDRQLVEWEKQDREARGEKPRAPQEPQAFVTSDATIEALGELLRENPHGVLLARDELDAWFQSFTRYKKGGGGTDRPQWLEMHKAGTLILNRLTREHKRLSVRRAAVSLTGTIQPVILRDAFDRQSLQAGLGARFLMAMPPPRKRVWTEDEIPDALQESYKQLLLNLLGLPLADAARRRPHYVGLTQASHRHWVEFYNEWGEVQFAAEGEQKSAFAKIEAYATRLMLVHHVVCELEANGPRTPKGDAHLPAVAESSALAGIELARWFAAEALRVYSTLHEGEAARETRRLVEWIESQGGRVTARQLQRSNNHKWYSVDLAAEALAGLAKAGFGDWKQGAVLRNGKSQTYFALHARQHDSADVGNEGDDEGDGRSDYDDSLEPAGAAAPEQL